MNNGNHNGAGVAIQPSVMNYRKLRSRKSYLGLTNAEIAKAVGVCVETVGAFLKGDDGVRPSHQDAIARVLKMRRVVDFEPIEIDRGFAETVAVAGVKYSIRYEAARGVWQVVQEGPFEEHSVGEFYGIGAEKMARFCADRLNEAVSFK